jgi:hypothetical protein
VSECHCRPDPQLARTKLHSSVTSCRVTSLHSGACACHCATVGLSLSLTDGCRAVIMHRGPDGRDLVNGKQLSSSMRWRRADHLPSPVACAEGEERTQAAGNCVDCVSVTIAKAAVAACLTLSGKCPEARFLARGRLRPSAAVCPRKLWYTCCRDAGSQSLRVWLHPRCDV